MSAQESVTSMSPGVFGEGETMMTGGRRRRSGVRRSRKTRGGNKHMKQHGGKRRTGKRRKTRGGFSFTKTAQGIGNKIKGLR